MCLKKMHMHNNIKTKKEKISYCSICSILSYDNIPLLSIPSMTTKNLSLNPFELKFRPFMFNIKEQNSNKIQYLKNRKNIINFLKIQSNFFSFPKIIFYKALSNLDFIYLNNNLPVEMIEKNSLICLYLTLKFNERCINNNLLDFTNFKSNIINIEFFKQSEILCLKCLDYDLGKYSTFDYINLFFSLGIIYSNQIKRNIDINKLYYTCLNYLDFIIEDNNSLNFSSYILALSIIKFVIENNNFFNSEIFYKIYGVDFKKEKYILCEKFLNLILYNNIQNSNCSKGIFYTPEIKKYITPRYSRDSTNENSDNNDI